MAEDCSRTQVRVYGRTVVTSPMQRCFAGFRRFSTRPLFPLLGLLTALLTGCVTDVRPIGKIGLLAPFEGLYRRTGYEALATMRAAIADNPSVGTAVLPLALDDGADPGQARRSAQKLRVDPQVVAVVGPLAPQSALGAADILNQASTPWLPGYLPPGQPQALSSAGAKLAWLDELVQGVGRLAREQGAASLLLAGLPADLLSRSTAEWTSVAGLPTQVGDDPATVPEDGAVLWLGRADGAATFLTALRTRLADVPLWMGPWGGDPVFFERAGSYEHVYWITWTDARFEEWAETHDPNTPAAYLVYRATEEALRAAGHQPADDAPNTWHLQAYAVQTDGSSIPFLLEP